VTAHVPFVRCNRELLCCPQCGEGALRRQSILLREPPDLQLEVADHRVEVAPVELPPHSRPELRIVFYCDHCSFEPDRDRPFVLVLSEERGAATLRWASEQGGEASAP